MAYQPVTDSHNSVSHNWVFYRIYKAVFLKGSYITAVCRIQEYFFRVSLALKTTEKNGMASSVVSDLAY